MQVMSALTNGGFCHFGDGSVSSVALHFLVALPALYSKLNPVICKVMRPQSSHVSCHQEAHLCLLRLQVHRPLK